ncbi:MAG: cell division protein FtsZ [Chloroflexi bacterium]|nr:cell division protein FtsZ [Chloroflexota bacterium]
MKLLVIGLGQCGGRIADEFARLNGRARNYRRIEIVPSAIAVNTDSADLSGLKAISKDYRHRILIGGRKTGGHGVGKVNELGAEVAMEDSDKIIEAVSSGRHSLEADAFLLIASAGGGTGSGSIAVTTRALKERYDKKPIYDLVILPFEHEAATEERTIHNTATCLKSAYSVADAVFIVDNQRYINKDASIINNMNEINRRIAAPFYDILCAGEEEKTKYIGSKTLDAGDIIQTIRGWTVLGYGQSPLPKFKLPFFKKNDFKSKNRLTSAGITAMDEAMSELSLGCDLADAGTTLYLMSAPRDEMNMELAKELGDYLRSKAPNAVIRNGDYPRNVDSLSVHLIVSSLNSVDRIRRYYAESVTLAPEQDRRREESERKLRSLEEVGMDVPSLLEKK